MWSSQSCQCLQMSCDDLQPDLTAAQLSLRKDFQPRCLQDGGSYHWCVKQHRDVLALKSITSNHLKNPSLVPVLLSEADKRALRWNAVRCRYCRCQCHTLAGAAKDSPSLLSWGRLRRGCYRTATLRVFFASPLEMEHVLLSSRLLCFLLALWMLGLEPSNHPSSAKGCLGLWCGTSNLPSLARQCAGTLCHASALPSSCLLLCCLLGSFCNIRGT